jgi:hypothetical protein
VVSVCNATNDLDALVFNGTTFVGSRMARLVSLATFHRLAGNKTQSSMLCEQAVQLWVESGDRCATLLQCKLVHSCVSILCSSSANSRALHLVKRALCFVQSRADIHSIDPSLQVWLLQHTGRMHRERKELSIALSFFRRASECAAESLAALFAPADLEVEGPAILDFLSDDADADSYSDAAASAAVDSYKHVSAQSQALRDQVLAAVWWSRYFGALCLRKLGQIEEASRDLNELAATVRTRIGIDRNPALMPSSSCKNNSSCNEYVIWNLLGIVSGFLGSILPSSPSQSEEAAQLLTFASKVAALLGQKDQAARWLSLVKAPKSRAKPPLSQSHGQVPEVLASATTLGVTNSSGSGSSGGELVIGNGGGGSNGADGGVRGIEIAISAPRPAAPRAWMRDEDAPSCCVCNVAFSFFRRRHHCRICLRVVCADCCKKQLLAPDSTGAVIASAEAILCCTHCKIKGN